MQTEENQIKSVQGFPGLVQKLSWDSSITAGVRSVCVLWAAGLIRSGDIETAQQVLTSLLTLPGGTSRLTDKTPVQFAVRLHQGSPPLTDENTKALVYILLASCYLSKDKLENCREMIVKANVTKFKPLSIYIKAWSLYKEQRATDGVTALQALTPADLESTEVCLRARIHCLTGCFLSKLGKPHTAVHHLKAALEADFRYTVALYYIAEQYKQLCMESAELEALNLLITTLENSSGTPAPCDVTLDQQVSSAVIRLLDLPYTVSVVQVQYLLAVRCLELHRYKAAYQRYMDLMAVIMKSDVIQCDGKLIKIPRLHQIFLETIQSSLKCKKLEECVTLCDQALLSGPVGVTSECIPPAADPYTTLTDHTAGKRKRVASSQQMCEEDSSANHITACLFHKAEALQLLGELQEAAHTLHSAADQLEKRLSGVTEERTHGDSDHRPQMKRARLSSDNQTTVYFLTKELLLLNRSQEAVSIWLESRKISSKMDSFQLDREIQTRETKLKNMSSDISDNPPNKRELLAMDVKILKALLHHRQNHVWRVS
ncbi:Fanconi anemia group G protein-like isoform X2 [Liolophura sinensis]|uniref:Fanconi anemia group G protein-like isoform X2 n=1 Tax=Liolophura sinensis TaxID=3198878 RepID=UPI0031593C4E